MTGNPKAGKNPIVFESVPAGACGVFSLLYIPVDLMGKPSYLILREMADDLVMIVKALRSMFLEYGFGAKTGDMFGLAQDKLNSSGVLNVHNPDPKDTIPEIEEPHEPEIVRLFRLTYPNEDFILKTKEWKKAHSASQGESYKKAREAYNEYQKQQASIKHGSRSKKRKKVLYLIPSQ